MMDEFLLEKVSPFAVTAAFDSQAETSPRRHPPPHQLHFPSLESAGAERCALHCMSARVLGRSGASKAQAACGTMANGSAGGIFLRAESREMCLDRAPISNPRPSPNVWMGQLRLVRVDTGISTHRQTPLAWLESCVGRPEQAQSEQPPPQTQPGLLGKHTPEHPLGGQCSCLVPVGLVWRCWWLPCSHAAAALPGDNAIRWKKKTLSRCKARDNALRE